MICERCNGKGQVHMYSQRETHDLLVLVPCPECNGCGQASCCQGHEAQPEPGDED